MIASLLAGCGGSSSSSSGGGTSGGGDTPRDYHLELKLSHVFGPTEQLAVSVQEAADNIREKTSGANFISVEDPSYIGDYAPGFKAVYDAIGGTTPVIYDMRKDEIAKMPQ